MWYSIIGVIVFLGQYLFYNWNPNAYFLEILKYKNYSFKDPTVFFHFSVLVRSLLWPIFIPYFLRMIKK